MEAPAWMPIALDTDGDGEFDDPAPTGAEAPGTLPASVAVRATSSGRSCGAT